MADKREIEQLILANKSTYGNTVYLLGTSSFGATNEPVMITSLAHLYSVFGLKGSLIDAYKTITKVSNNIKIYCCKVTGTHAGASFNVNVSGDSIEENALIFKSKCSNEVYNDILINVYPDMITFEFPGELGNELISYKYEDYLTIGNLIRKINSDTDNGLNHVYVRTTVEESTELLGALDSVNASSTYMYGATSGLTVSKNSMYQALKDTYELLDGKLVDIIIPLEAYIDDIEVDGSSYGVSEYGGCSYANGVDKLSGSDNGCIKSFYNILLKFCARQLASGIATLGVIGYNKTNDKYIDENIDKYVDNIYIQMLKLNQFDESLEIYRPLVSVVAGDLLSSTTGEHFNGYAVYGAALGGIDLVSTPTNKPISNSLFLYNEFNEEQLLRLGDNGIVAFRHSAVKDRVVVSSSVTSCDSSSEMYYVQNVRMIQFSVSCIYDIFEKYIGEDLNDLMKNNKLKDAIVSGLSVLRDSGMLSSYNVSVSRVNDHDVKLILELKTEYMVDFIKSICTVSSMEV